MTRTLEYLDEALDEAEEAARWYAERSATAAAGFADELDVAAAEIERRRQPGRRTTTGHAGSCCVGFRTAWSIESSRPESSSLPGRSR